MEIVSYNDKFGHIYTIITNLVSLAQTMSKQTGRHDDDDDGVRWVFHIALVIPLIDSSSL